MKLSNVIKVLFAVILFSSCGDTEEIIDFSGIYIGPISCMGESHEVNGEEATFTISKTGAESYNVDLGDDLVFTATQERNELIIGKQTANEGNGFDEVTLDGRIRSIENGISMVFNASVDDEGQSSCDMELIKQ